MILPRIVFVLLVLFHLVSCKDSVIEKHDAEQNNTKVPSTEYQKIEKPKPNGDSQRPNEESLDKELKKKKRKAIDTLKPVVAIP